MLNRIRAYPALVRQALARDSRSDIRADVLLACGDGDRAYRFNGRRYAQLTDSIGERMTRAGITVASVAYPGSRLRAGESFGNVIVANGDFARAALADSLAKVATFGRAQPRARTVAAWRRILTACGTKAVVAIQPPVELCIAARAAGVWIADLQHGIIAGDPYYEPRRAAGIGADAWPHRILVWDAGSAAVVRDRLGGLSEPDILGNPWFARFAVPDASDELVRDAASDLRPEAGAAVLVTLQWGLEGRADYHPIGLPNALVALMRQSDPSTLWWLRLHPVSAQHPHRAEFLGRLRDTFGDEGHVAWTWCSRAPLPLVLARAAAHITSHSAVTIEAAWFGIRTALIDTRRAALEQFFANQLRMGLAEIVSPDADSLAAWLDRAIREGRPIRPAEAVSPVRISMFIEAMREFVRGRRREPSVGL